MLLTEVQGKRLFQDVGIPVPPSLIVHDREEIRHISPVFPAVAKAQVASGGRGKAGGIKRCDLPQELQNAFSAIMKMSFGGAKPSAVLVEPWLEIARELYLAVTIDGRADGYSVLYSPVGGVDVESGNPLLRHPIGPLRNFRAHLFRQALAEVEPDSKIRERIIGLTRRLLQCAHAHDCLTLEINPLILLKNGSLIAGDAKVVLDDAAEFRHQFTAAAIAEGREKEPEDVRTCAEHGLMLLWLDGATGLISSGAGMTMGAMDAIDAAGGRAACFLDVSGNPTPTGFSLAFDLLDRSPQVRGILVSMFGGGLHMDRVARTLIDIMAKRTSTKPVAFRLNGTRSEIAAKLLAEAGLRNHRTLEDAVEAIVHATKEPV